MSTVQIGGYLFEGVTEKIGARRPVADGQIEGGWGASIAGQPNQLLIATEVGLVCVMDANDTLLPWDTITELSIDTITVSRGVVHYSLPESGAYEMLSSIAGRRAPGVAVATSVPTGLIPGARSPSPIAENGDKHQAAAVTTKAPNGGSPAATSLPKVELAGAIRRAPDVAVNARTHNGAPSKASSPSKMVSNGGRREPIRSPRRDVAIGVVVTVIGAAVYQGFSAAAYRAFLLQAGTSADAPSGMWQDGVASLGVLVAVIGLVIAAVGGISWGRAADSMATEGSHLRKLQTLYYARELATANAPDSDRD